VSVAVKEALYVQRTLNQSFTTTLQTVNFNNTILSRGINYSSANSQFSLKQGKSYRITFATTMIFDSTNAYVGFGLYRADDVRLSDVTGLFMSVASATNEAPNSILDIIYTPTADINAAIKVATISPTTTAMIRAGHGNLIIQEL